MAFLFGSSSYSSSQGSSSSSASNSPHRSHNHPSSSQVVSPAALSDLRGLLQLPKPNVSARSTPANAVCTRHNLTFVQYKHFYENPGKLIRASESQPTNSHNSRHHNAELENLYRQLRAKDELIEVKIRDIEQKEREIGDKVREIQELKGRKVHSPETYHEAMTYLGVGKDTSIDMVRNQALEIFLGDTHSDTPATVAENCFIIIATTRDESPLLFPENDDDLHEEPVAKRIKIEETETGFRPWDGKDLFLGHSSSSESGSGEEFVFDTDHLFQSHGQDSFQGSRHPSFEEDDDIYS